MISSVLMVMLAAAAAPEISRAPAAPQAIGATHLLRNVPEACMRLEGAFTAAGYAPKLVPRIGCQVRAAFALQIGDAPPQGEGWILNDVLRVPRADRPECVATISVYRHPGALAPMHKDGQQRVRMYLNEAERPAGERPRFAAMLETTPECAAP